MAITETPSFTGRFGNATIRTIAIGITGWDATVRKAFDDGTDSNNYDPVTVQTWTSQQPGVVGVDASVEGNFDTGGLVDTNLIQIFKTDGPYAMTLSFSRTLSFCSGNWDFSDVHLSVKVPGSTMVTFTANAKSNGIITLT